MEPTSLGEFLCISIMNMITEYDKSCLKVSLFSLALGLVDGEAASYERATRRFTGITGPTRDRIADG